MENLWEENCSKIDSVADSVEQGVQAIFGQCYQH